MTPWSPKQQQPKTTTISRRLRNRADQNLSVQPPQLPASTNRPRRVSTLPAAPHQNPVDYQTPEPHPPSIAWQTPDTLEHIQPTSTSTLTNTEEGQTRDLLPAPTVNYSAYASPQSSQPDVASTREPHNRPRTYQFQSTPGLGFLPSPLPSASDSHEFELRLSADPEQSTTNSFLELQDMSTLGFMMPPSQYGMNHYGSPQTSYSPSYPAQQSYADPRSSASGPYDSSYAPTSAVPNATQPRRLEEHAAVPSYQQQQQQQPQSRSPYPPQQPANAMRGAAPLTSTAQGYSYPAPQNSIPSQPLQSGSAAYPPQPVYPPVTYSVGEYHPLPTMYPPSTTTTAPSYTSYGPVHDVPPPATSGVSALTSSPSAPSNAVMPRILNSRPKPQCWEHGCNGRQFSTFSNLLRHQREKSGTASKSYCPRCNAEFTRTTARNGHMAHDKCKPRRTSDP